MINEIVKCYLHNKKEERLVMVSYLPGVDMWNNNLRFFVSPTKPIRLLTKRKLCWDSPGSGRPAQAPPMPRRGRCEAVTEEQDGGEGLGSEKPRGESNPHHIEEPKGNNLSPLLMSSQLPSHHDAFHSNQTQQPLHYNADS
ncbi:hypothetical protein E2C01_014486 [Portunus trituberculatus]|uniref:Uncharacterized protein n=1 Tax=Portunus trituberculatus TaxID=210409 RepID=A0A5B7DKK7_PORTR|nr:hypothetical protein [Portunus trituberculatus]